MSATFFCAPIMAESAAVATAVVTIVDGPASLLEGVRRQVAAPGLKLAAGTIIETATNTRLLRIEWPHGEVLNLGPDTRAMLSPPGFSRRDRGPAIYLLQGWVKYGSAPGAETRGLVARLFELAPFKGVVVAHVNAKETWLFIEAGKASLTERQIRPPARHDLSSGNFYSRSGDAAGAAATRAASSSLKEVPRAFRDTLPLRYAQVVASAPPTAEPLPAPTYADLQSWLTAEVPVRAGFTRSFRPLLADRSFRRDLDSHLSDHGEWRPILYPPPPPTPPSAPSAATQTR